MVAIELNDKGEPVWKLVRETDGYWGVTRNGVKVMTQESYEVCSQIVEGGSCGEEIRRSFGL